jgi:hypothetical protein
MVRTHSTAGEQGWVSSIQSAAKKEKAWQGLNLVCSVGSEACCDVLAVDVGTRVEGIEASWQSSK